jgi:hypothetical protein
MKEFSISIPRKTGLSPNVWIYLSQILYLDSAYNNSKIIFRKLANSTWIAYFFAECEMPKT